MNLHLHHEIPVVNAVIHWTKTPRQPNVTVLGCSSGVEPAFEAFKLSREKRTEYLKVSSGQIDQRFVIPRLDGRIYLPCDRPIQPGTLPQAEPQLTMAGAAGSVQRDGTLVLRDGQGMAVLIGRSGLIESLCCGGQEVIDLIAPVIVTDSKWKNVEPLRERASLPAVRKYCHNAPTQTPKRCGLGRAAMRW